MLSIHQVKGILIAGQWTLGLLHHNSTNAIRSTFKKKFFVV
uniref:Uncharacterized protein n=1 Tax=Arundo donax TaxID=35708 RepID=A0A0A9FW13_ARUDO